MPGKSQPGLKKSSAIEVRDASRLAQSERKMADATPMATRQSLTGAGLAALLGLFAGLCTIFAAIVTLVEWRDAHVQAGWPLVSAMVERADLVAVPRNSGGGGATTWHLRYRVHYELNGTRRAATVMSRTAFSEADAAVLQAWAGQHGKGQPVDVRYDPPRDSRAVFASTEVADAVNRLATDCKLLAMFAAAAAGLLALARYLRARASAAPAGEADDGASGHLAMGLLFAGLGALVAGSSLYRAIHADPIIADNFVGVPAGLMFVFAGILLGLSPQSSKWRGILATLLITCFAVTFDWVAFGPGERKFSGSVMGFGFLPSELVGRIAFGFFAVVLDVCAVTMWIDQCRRALGYREVWSFSEIRAPTD
jgi:hypothetical protein